MAYSIEEEDKMLAMFEAIANQPIEQQRPYNEVKNPKPIVESACFEGVKVDFSGWTEDKKKVGKAKTASNPDLAKQSKKAPKVTDVSTKGTAVATKGTDKPVTKNDTVTEKKEDKQVTKLVTEDASHESKGEPKAKTGAFDSKAKSTASAQRSKADSNKKFSEESKRQRKIDMFRDFVKSLGVDKESKEAAEKVLKKFDQISKHIGEPGDGKVKPKMESADADDVLKGLRRVKRYLNRGNALSMTNLDLRDALVHKLHTGASAITDMDEPFTMQFGLHPNGENSDEYMWNIKMTGRGDGRCEIWLYTPQGKCMYSNKQFNPSTDSIDVLADEIVQYIKGNRPEFECACEPGDGKVKPKQESAMGSELVVQDSCEDNNLTESVNLMEAADGSTTVYTYGGNKKLSVTDGKISGIEGSQSLAKCNGFPIKVLTGDKGGELTAEIQVNGKWLRWNSHAPINDVSTGSSANNSNEDNEGKESNGSAETAGPVKNCGITFRGSPEYKGNTMANVAEQAIEAYCNKSGKKFPDKKAWASFTDEAHMKNGVIILFRGPESFADGVVNFVKSNEKLNRILGEARSFTMSDKVFASYCDRGYPICHHMKCGYAN